MSENNQLFGQDLMVGHTTWSDYSKMTRIFKYYHFRWAVIGKSQPTSHCTKHCAILCGRGCDLYPKIETFRGATGPLPAGPTPLAPTPPPGPDLDLILTRFGPDFDLKSAFSGPNRVEIGSKSGPGGGVGARWVSLAGGSL